MLEDDEAKVVDQAKSVMTWREYVLWAAAMRKEHEGIYLKGDLDDGN